MTYGEKMNLPQPSQREPVEQPPFQQQSAQSAVFDNPSSAYQTSVSVGKPRTNQRVAAAYLQTHELQDLVEKIAEIKSAAAGIDLKFKIQIEVAGESQPSYVLIRLLDTVCQFSHAPTEGLDCQSI